MPVPDISGLYGAFRSRELHNLSSPGLVYVSGLDDRDAHGGRDEGGRLVIHAERLVEDVRRAFREFVNTSLVDPTIGRLAIHYFEKNPPVQAMTPEAPVKVEKLSGGVGEVTSASATEGAAKLT